MTALNVTKDDSIYVVTMNDRENNNTFSAKVIEQHHAVLNELESVTGNCAVVITSSDPKTWSQGINLPWLQAQSPIYWSEFMTLMDGFLKRWALLDMPTIGCLTGHTFAGGAILASAMDFRLMREDRGWFCFSEVDVKVPITPVMHAIVDLLPTPQARRDLLLTGRRLGANEAAELGVVDRACASETLFQESMELARSLAKKDRYTYGSLKRGLRMRIPAQRA